MVTGSADWWEPVEQGEEFDRDSWDKNRLTPSVQEKLLAELFQHYDAETKSYLNVSDLLVVERVEADDCGGLGIHLSGGYRLQVFPDGQVGEHWRLFEPGRETAHFVMETGALYTDRPKS